MLLYLLQTRQALFNYSHPIASANRFQYCLCHLDGHPAMRGQFNHQIRQHPDFEALSGRGHER
jgi:hypothetical protein